MVNTKKAWYELPKSDNFNFKKWMLVPLVGIPLITGAALGKKSLDAYNLRSMAMMKNSDQKVEQKVDSDKKFTGTIDDKVNSKPNVVLSGNNIETYVDAPKAKRVYLGGQPQRGFVGTNSRSSINSRNQPQVYTVNNLEMDAQRALAYLSNKEDACMSAIFALEESKGKVYSKGLESVGEIAEQVLKAKGKWNKEKNKRTRNIARGKYGNRIEKYPAREVGKIVEEFGDVLAGVNAHSTIDGKISYLKQVKRDIDENQEYIQSNLSYCMNNKVVDSDLKAKLYAINAQSGRRSSRQFGFNTRGSGRGYVSSGRFTR